MSTETVRSRRAAIVATCPLLLLTALVWHPYLAGRQPNVHALAHAVASDPTRWGIVHLATGVGSALMALAFIAIRNHLHESGETRWSNRGLPLVVLGSTLVRHAPSDGTGPPRRRRVGRRPCCGSTRPARLVRASARPQRGHVRSGDGLLRAQRVSQQGRGARPRPAHRGLARRLGELHASCPSPQSSSTCRASPAAPRYCLWPMPSGDSRDRRTRPPLSQPRGDARTNPRPSSRDTNVLATGSPAVSRPQFREDVAYVAIDRALT